MSWLTELAGKAENLLNKLDSEVASAVTKEPEKNFKAKSVQSHSSYPFPNSVSVPSNLNTYSDVQVNIGNVSRGPASLTGTPRKVKTANLQKEEERYFMELLNSEKELPVTENLLLKSNNGSVVSTQHSRQSSLSSASSFFAVGETVGFISSEMESSGGSGSTDQYVKLDAPTESLEILEDSPIGSHSNDGSENEREYKTSLEKNIKSDTECAMLRKEISSLNQEMNQVLRRAKNAEKETKQAKYQLLSLSSQLKETESLIQCAHKDEEKLQFSVHERDVEISRVKNELKLTENKILEREKTIKELQEQNQRLLTGANITSTLHSDAVASLQERVKDLDGELEKEKHSHSATREELNQRSSHYEDEQKSMLKELSEAQRRFQEGKSKTESLNSQINSLRCEVSTVRDELSDYKDKAGRVLQSKDKLILSLKEGSGAEGLSRDTNDILKEEIEQLRSEKNLLLEEVEKYSQKQKQLLIDLSEAEALSQQELANAVERLLHLQEELKTEKAESSLAQEELKQSQQELKSVKEELTRQKVRISTRLQERDEEIERLQNQIAHKQSSSSSISELESRIHGLTESLILKQNNIEALSTDKHSLQIQMEKLQRQYQESQNMLNIDAAVESSQDDVRNRLPMFLMESPFDGKVTRRVKKAYGTLDKFSVRLGIFLRRYPIARVFVLLYMCLLHIWVMVVLLTYTPEIHGPEFHHSVGPESVIVHPQNG